MRRRPLRSGISWLLALVLMRSLIPAGFMPAWVDGAFTLILCDGHAYSASAGSSAHQHHHHQDGKSRTGGAEQSGEDCSYAQSANPALASTLDLTSAAVHLLVWDTPALHAGVPGSAPLRYRSARGPPAVS